MTTIIRILDFLRIVRGVWLKDYQGCVTAAIENKTPFGKHCYWGTPYTIGLVVMNDNGTTWGEASYVSEWKYMRESK